MQTIKYMGGWGENNDVLSGKHIDPTMRPILRPCGVFVWLFPAHPQPETVHPSALARANRACGYMVRWYVTSRGVHYLATLSWRT